MKKKVILKKKIEKKKKKTKIKRKKGKVSKKKKRKALWITVVIHSVLCGGTLIPLYHLEYVVIYIASINNSVLICKCKKHIFIYQLKKIMILENILIIKKHFSFTIKINLESYLQHSTGYNTSINYK